MDILTFLFFSASVILTGATVVVGIRRCVPIWLDIVRTSVSPFLGQASRLDMNVPLLECGLQIWIFSTMGIAAWIWLQAHAIPLAIVFAFLAWRLPVHFLESLVNRRKNTYRRQLVDVTIAIGNGTRAGLALPEALAYAAEHARKPFSIVTRRITREFELGRPLAKAIASVRNRLQLDSFSIFGSALEAAIERGGNIQEALDRIGLGLEEHSRLERKMQIDTSSGRVVVLTLAVFPALFLAFFYSVDPALVRFMFDGLIGQILTAGVAMMVYVAVRLGVRITTLKV